MLETTQTLEPEDSQLKMDNDACLNIQDGLALEDFSMEDVARELSRRSGAAKGRVKFKKIALQNAKKELEAGGQKKGPDAYFEQKIARRKLEARMARKELKLKEEQEAQQQSQLQGAANEPEETRATTGTKAKGLVAGPDVEPAAQAEEARDSCAGHKKHLPGADWQRGHVLGEQLRKGLERAVAEQLKKQILHGAGPE